MRYCLKCQSDINLFPAVFLSLSALGASPCPGVFLWSYSNASLGTFCFCSLLSFESCALLLGLCVRVAVSALGSSPAEHVK